MNTNTFETFMKDTTNTSTTLNGAKMYATTNKPLLNCNFAVSNWRSANELDIVSQFRAAYVIDRKMAITWLFFLRDCRGGLGERRAFRLCMSDIANNEPEEFVKIASYIPEFGRWDDLVELYFSTTELASNYECYRIIRDQFRRDISDVNTGLERCSLLAKWLPSVNTSSDEQRRRGKHLAKLFSMPEKEYRQTLSKLRKVIKVVECDMSANRWQAIDYSTVPAKAAMNYANAFMKHDEERRCSYIQDVMLGKAKANIGGLNPYEVWHKAIEEHSNVTGELYESVWDKLVEGGLPDTDAFDDCLCVVDTSGSMMAQINNTTSVRDIAYSLGTYFAQKGNGPFKNKCITFSAHPNWIDLSGVDTCWDKYQIFNNSDWGMNTNIEAVFDLVLSAARSEKVSEEDMPKSLLIVSDMQFDNCVNGCRTVDSTINLFDHIAYKWHEAGYQLPKLIFWSLDTWHTTGDITVPMIDCGDNGIALISGFSQNAAKAATSEKKDPYDALIEVLMSDRYEVIRKALS